MQGLFCSESCAIPPEETMQKQIFSISSRTPWWPPWLEISTSSQLLKFYHPARTETLWYFVNFPCCLPAVLHGCFLLEWLCMDIGLLLVCLSTFQLTSIALLVRGENNEGMKFQYIASLLRPASKLWPSQRREAICIVATNKYSR